MSLRLREATLDDLPVLSRLGVDAFENDALSIGMFPPSPTSPDRHRYDRLRDREVRTRMRMMKPRALTMAVVDDGLGGQIVGYAQWVVPVGEEDVEEEEVEDLEKVVEGAGTPTLDREATRYIYACIDGEAKRVLGKDGTRHVWYLGFLAVDPAHQRRGIGKMLVKWGLEKAKSQGKGFYLSSTPAGRQFYLSLGLQEAGGYEIFGTYETSMVLPGLTHVVQE